MFRSVNSFAGRSFAFPRERTNPTLVCRQERQPSTRSNLRARNLETALADGQWRQRRILAAGRIGGVAAHATHAELAVRALVVRPARDHVFTPRTNATRYPWRRASSFTPCTNSAGFGRFLRRENHTDVQRVAAGHVRSLCERAGFSQTEMCARLSLVNGSLCQPLQRSRKRMPAIWAIRSSSAGHT